MDRDRACSVRAKLRSIEKENFIATNFNFYFEKNISIIDH